MTLHAVAVCISLEAYRGMRSQSSRGGESYQIWPLSHAVPGLQSVLNLQVRPAMSSPVHGLSCRDKVCAGVRQPGVLCLGRLVVNIALIS